MGRPAVMGRIALVTGAGRGIGLATARALLEAGAPVALCDIDEQRVEEAVRELGRIGPKARAYPLDVREPRQWEAVLKRVKKDLGPVDVLVNNAGIMPLGGFLKLDPAVDARQIDINVHGVVHGMRAVLPGMVTRGRGHIVNIASAAGKVGMPYAAVYSAAKHAVVGLTEAVRHEFQPHGVQFTYVMPSLVDTELISGAGRVRWPPVARPEDVADAILDALETGRVDVYVPRVARLAAVLPALFPRRVYERIGTLLGLATIFADVDHEARAAYRARTEGS